MPFDTAFCNDSMNVIPVPWTDCRHRGERQSSACARCRSTKRVAGASRRGSSQQGSQRLGKRLSRLGRQSGAALDRNPRVQVAPGTWACRHGDLWHIVAVSRRVRAEAGYRRGGRRRRDAPWHAVLAKGGVGIAHRAVALDSPASGRRTHSTPGSGLHQDRQGVVPGSARAALAAPGLATPVRPGRPARRSFSGARRDGRRA